MLGADRGVPTTRTGCPSSELVGDGDDAAPIAGHETTVNLIGNAMLGLLTHPDQLGGCCANPPVLPAGGRGVPALGLAGDAPRRVRFTTEDVEIRRSHHPGRVDGDALARPRPTATPTASRAGDELRVDRDAGGHVAFGHGLHFCIGAQLARIEGEVAIGALLARRPGLALAVDPVELVYRHSSLVRGLRSLPVDVG